MIRSRSRIGENTYVRLFYALAIYACPLYISPSRNHRHPETTQHFTSFRCHNESKDQNLTPSAILPSSFNANATQPTEGRVRDREAKLRGPETNILRLSNDSHTNSHCGRGSILQELSSKHVFNNPTSSIPPHPPRIAGGLAPIGFGGLGLAAAAHRIRQGQVRAGFDPGLDANSGGI